MKKRILSLLLAVALCLSLLPTAALAEEGTEAVAEVTMDGDVRSCATLQEAFDAVENCTESSIASVKLLTDITLESGLTIPGGVFTLDLNGKTVTHSDVDANAVSMTAGIVTLTDHDGTGSGTIGQKFVVNGGTLNMSGGKIAGSLVLGDLAGQISLSGGSFDSIRIDTPAEGKPDFADLLAEGCAFQKNGELQYLQSITGESTIENVAVVKCTHPDTSIGECPYCGSTVEMEEIKSITAVGDGTGNWLNGASWWPDNASNHMTETSTGSGVYEITYTGVAAGDYTVKFAANDAWTHNWGAAYDDEYNPLPDVAAYKGDTISFSVAEDNSTVKLVLDLSELDRATGAGAAYAITAYTPSIQPGASDIKGWSADDGYDYIYLGSWNNNPVKWRVLTANGDTAKSYSDTPAGYTSNKSNALFMLSGDVLAQTQFGGSGNKKWEGSTAESWCDGFKTGALTAQEQLAVFTTASKSGANGDKYNGIIFDRKNSSLLRSNGNKVFFLSVIEANESAYGFSNNDARKATGGAWWLLSRTTKGYGFFGTVSSDGAFQSTAVNSSAGARPALNLDKRQVLFTAAADNSAHTNALAEPTGYNGREFKLTLKDSNTFADGAKIVGGRTIWNNAYTNATITIQHKALEDISDTYNNVTAALTDSEGTLLYYGSVNRDPGATRTVVTLPEGLKNGIYTLSLYGEDWNGAQESDFATGTPFTVEITIRDGADGPDLTPREQDGLLTIDKITGCDARWGYNYLYFGKFGTDPILWRVLSTSGNATGAADSLKQGEDTVSNENAMFLLSEYLLGQGSGIVFNENGTAYQGSNAQIWCGNDLLEDFTEKEQNAMLATTKSDAASANDRNLQFPAAENILNGDQVFLPSVEEMKSKEYGFSSENDLIAHYGSTAGEWWMRSAGTGASIADAEYNGDRTEYKIYAKRADHHSYARPAFNLSKNDVLFVCTADGVKTGTAVSTLTVIESNLSSEWKLTLRDESRDFRVTETEVKKFAGDTLTLNYTGAQTGENEYISAIFYDADGKPAYYGMLKNLTDEADAEGSVELTVPAGLAEGRYQIVLFNEQYSGEYMTDYASRFCTVTLTVDNTIPELSDFAVSRASDSTASVTFSASESGAYYYAVDGNETLFSIDTTGNGIAMITGKQTLELDNIPAGKSYLHIVAKDVAGNMCDVQTIPILGFLPAPATADWEDAALGKASWSAVANASGYSVQLYKDGAAFGSPVRIDHPDTTSYPFTIPEPPAADSGDSTATTPPLPDNAITEAGAYSFRVTALGDGTDYSNSVPAKSARHLSSITVESNKNGAITASARYAVSGTEITLTGDPNSGYRFHEWNIAPEVTVTDNKFVMPEEAVTVSAVFTRRPSSSTYPITVKDSTNGSAVSSHKSASSGTTVTIAVKPDTGYTLETLTVTDKNGKEVKLTEKNGKYAFIMPASQVTVTVTFMDDNTMLNFFVDVKASDYYYDAVLWAAQNGITSGTDAEHFRPNQPCTRAQIVTFLWRAAGSPAPKAASMPFTDVPKGSYYETAVLWAVENGITKGTVENGITKGTSDTTFSPDATCSRAQIVAFLWRSQKSSAVGSVNPFTDVSANAYYTDAVLWAVEENITKGTTATTFSPDADCTRAQIVTFLFRTYQDQ